MSQLTLIRIRTAILLMAAVSIPAWGESPMNHAGSIDRGLVAPALEAEIEDDYVDFRNSSGNDLSMSPDFGPIQVGEKFDTDVPWLYRPRFLKTESQIRHEAISRALPRPVRLFATNSASRLSVTRTKPTTDPSMKQAQLESYEYTDVPPFADTPQFDDIIFTEEDSTPYSSIVLDPPIDYSGPTPSSDRDEDLRDGPRVPEPMVFDLVRGLGARQGELEFNVLNLVPFQRGKTKYEWAPEVEYVPFDGFGIEYEMPIFNTEIVAHKFGLQYTFGTALDDAFIHGVQHISYYDVQNPQYIPTLLYLTGLRLDKVWSLFGMYGFSLGPQVFPFADESTPYGLNVLVNLSIFANVTEHLVLGLETNFDRQVGGPLQTLIMPQMHYELTEHFKVQFGFGLRDEVTSRFGELGFRVIVER